MNIKRVFVGITFALTLTLVLTFLCSYLYAEPFPIPLRLAMLFGVQALFFGIALISNGIVEKLPFSRLGYASNDLKWQLVWAAVLFAGLSFIFIAIPLLFGMNDIFPARDLLAFAIPHKLFVGFAEETLFRGYILNALFRLHMKKPAAILLSSLLFGAWHFILSGNIFQVIVTAIIGVIFALPIVYVKKCTVLSTALAHGMYDALLSILAYVV
jgi:membrane protease YdiL (CAAX protease family)